VQRNSVSLTRFFRCKELEDKLIALVWKFRPDPLKTGSPAPSLRTFSGYDGLTAHASQTTIDPITGEMGEKDFSENEKRGETSPEVSNETEADKPASRPTRLFAPIYNGLGAALGLGLTLEGLRKMLIEFWQDGGKLRFILICVFPFLFCVSLVSALKFTLRSFLIYSEISSSTTSS
jgi:hypothetical protein